jgi:enoyl-CoA hydratase
MTNLLKIHSNSVTGAGFGIFPSWGLSRNLPRVIGPHRARQVSLTSESVDAQTAE